MFFKCFVKFVRWFVILMFEIQKIGMFCQDRYIFMCESFFVFKFYYCMLEILFEEVQLDFLFEWVLC